MRGTATFTNEISKEDYEKALKEGASSLVSDSIKMGYGLYGSSVSEVDGKYYLTYERGSSCD